MENRIKVGITHGDVNGIGYEIILKTFEDPSMFEFCTPVLYGSPKIATYHRKAVDSQTNFNVVNSASEAIPDRLNLVNCCDEDVKVDLGVATAESGNAAFNALERAVKEYREGMIDVLVTAPINKKSIHSDKFRFMGHTEYIESELGEGRKALMILMNSAMRVALVTVHEPLSKVASLLNKELIKEKITILNSSLKVDFGIEIPRIAVLALNPHASDDGLIGNEEETVIQPAIKECAAEGIQCFGPFPADGFFGGGDYRMFDAVLAMYHDQGLIPLKTLDMECGVNFTAGLPVVRTSPDHGTAYDIAGKGVANEQSLRQAIFTAIDIYRSRRNEAEISANPLPKLFFDRRDDSDKLKQLDSSDGDKE
ncbi:MAG: 4-hydroxythreonine-4-phosphate dehydrogenase PdxA [Bacteroidaceae bacterium]|nr:4-hydroxythreonine-4-phosphate dehydrogenase PdxA [Bacteroidaceae bacterium]